MADEMTIEQQRALALARARVRLQQARTIAQGAPVEPGEIGPNDAPMGPLNTQLADINRRNASYAPIEKLALTPELIGEKIKRTAASLGVRGGSTMLGEYIGGRYGGPVGRWLGRMGGAGVGNVIDQSRLINAGEQEKFSFGQLGGDLTSAALPTRGKIAQNPFVQGAGNVAAKAVETGIDEQRLPTFNEAGSSASSAMMGSMLANRVGVDRAAMLKGQQLMNDNAMKSFRALRGEGMKIAPQKLDLEGSGLLTTVAGPTVLSHEVSKNNQLVTQRLARRSLGLSDEPRPFVDRRVTDSGTVIPSDFDNVRLREAAPYAAIQKISEDAQANLKNLATAPGGHALAVQLNTPQAQKLLVEAAADVNTLKQARSAAQDAWNSKQEKPGTWRNEYEAATAQVENLENKIEAAAISAGQPKLAEQLRESRKIIAQSYAVERATMAGVVDARDLGAQLEDGVPLTGDLYKLGDFARNFDKESVQGRRIGNANVNNFTTQMSAVMAAQGDKKATLLGALNLLGPKQAAKRTLLSDFTQNRYAMKPEQFQDQFAKALLRYGGAEAGRDATR